ncbi:MAG: hypothetical protein LKM43_05175, partial [Wolbachia endosymbiont of Penenirmus auritus]|nr:hypothetical protein [Wolbachia endosymbiont of Penenirmus auritus]
RIRDEKAVLAQKLDDAREKGIEIGRQEGIQIGEERGIKIGAEKGKIEVAKAMLADNVDVNTIVKFTGLSISEIERVARLKDTQPNAIQ